MLITTAIPALAGLLTSTTGPAPEGDEALCSGCWAPAPGGADNARGNHGWQQDPDTGDLLCEDCATADGPTGPYDPTYWG